MIMIYLSAVHFPFLIVSTAICNLCTNPNRVLYLAMSPDGQNIVTGAGDDSLRFWNVFPGPRTGIRLGPSSLTPSGKDIR
jgi:cell division cycle 20-like protein 1, cofactor of APC complex